MINYKPSAFYYRQALDEAETIEDAKRIGRNIIRELEHHKEFIREKGLIPPKKFIIRAEAEAKGWGVKKLDD